MGQAGAMAGFTLDQLLAISVVVTNFGDKANRGARSFRGMLDSLQSEKVLKFLDVIFTIPEYMVTIYSYFFKSEMVNPVYKWIIVPLEVECKIGSNWYELEEVGKWSTLDWWEYKNNKWKAKA